MTVCSSKQISVHLKCGLTCNLIPVVIQITGCLLIFCHHWQHIFPAASVTVSNRAVWALGADSATLDPLAGYRDIAGKAKEGR